MREARLQAAQARPLRRRPHLHAAGRAAARPLRARVDAHHPRGGPGAPRLALGAGRQLAACPRWCKATEPVHRQVFIGRPKAMNDQQEFERRLYLIRKVVSNAHLLRLQGPRHRPLHGVAVEPHARLQGHVPVLPGEGLLHGPVRPAARLGDGARAPALLDQHLPVVEARAPLPHGRPQRRDQHAARQRQLDGGAAGVGVVAAVRQRHLQAVADLLRGPVGHRLLRQRARVPGDGRLQPGARGDDADPRGVGRQSADGCASGAPSTSTTPA